MKLLWVEAEALKICANTPTLAVEEVVIFEEFGMSHHNYKHI